MSHLTSKQRYAIGQLLERQYSIITISKIILVDKSVIYREVKRNCDKRNGVYNADLAQRKYEKRLKEKPKKIKLTEKLKKDINHYISLDYSPEQIVGYRKKKGLETVSVERIYQYIWEDKKQGGKLHKHLRNKGRRYRKRGDLKDSRGVLLDRNLIKNRPAIVEKKQRIGDLELDTIVGKNHQGAIVTINDRCTGMLWIQKVESKESGLVKTAIIELMQDWKPFLKTITSDNGKEFALHKEISEALDIDFYFADPYSPWQRGANENLNGLLRQYIPKSSSFEDLTQEKLYEIQEKINNRPRKRFNFETPNNMFNQKVAFET